MLKLLRALSSPAGGAFRSLPVPARFLGQFTGEHVPNEDQNYIISEPVFQKELMQHFLTKGKKEFLDMTFGIGGHTSLILNASAENIVIASDCDVNSVKAAEKMVKNYDSDRLRSVRSSFSDIIPKLNELGIKNRSFDGIIIDTGCSAFQWIDRQRGFCPDRSGLLDLRFAPDLDPSLPSASELLQFIEEAHLFKILTKYGNLKSRARPVVTAIIEARYMFHEFKTVEEMRHILQTAARAKPHIFLEGMSEEIIVKELLWDTITALRMFLNDELNELKFAIDVVAGNLLKPSGRLAVIVYNESERKVVNDALSRVNLKISNQNFLKMSDMEISALETNTLWKLICGPVRVTGDHAKNPRLSSGTLIICERTHVERDEIHV